MIIGITGTLGAGKGTISEYLIKKGFKHYSVRDFLTEEVKKRNLPLNRESLVNVANDLRKKHSPSYIVEKLFEIAKENNENCIIESIRTEGELISLQNKGGIVLAIDADPKIRFNRIKKRNSYTDNIDFKQFLEDEKKEMTSDDPNKQNLSKCIQLADYKIENNKSIEDLYMNIEKVIKNAKEKN
ncbi:MAG: AAA family ATPase [Candidatus Woesearchaeota archaeon]